MFYKMLKNNLFYVFCVLLVGTSTLHLKVIQVAAEPPLVFDHHVPVFTSEFAPLKQDYWDLTTKQVCTCFVNPYNMIVTTINWTTRSCRTLTDEATLLGSLSKLTWISVWLRPAFRISCKSSATPESYSWPNYISRKILWGRPTHSYLPVQQHVRSYTQTKGTTHECRAE